MRVYIGPYRSRWISRIHDNYMNNTYGRWEWDGSTTQFEHLIEKVEDVLQWIYNHSINLILDRLDEQKVSIRIDKYDIWGMDTTLAKIIYPMLLKLRDSKRGAPFVDDKDVPEELRSTNAEPKENDWDTDSNHFKRWDWVLDEMIFAFEQKNKVDWESEFYSYDHFESVEDSSSFSERLGVRLTWSDEERRKAYQKRISNGLRLFGKYYEALWN